MGLHGTPTTREGRGGYTRAGKRGRGRTTSSQTGRGGATVSTTTPFCGGSRGLIDGFNDGGGSEYTLHGPVTEYLALTRFLPTPTTPTKAFTCGGSFATPVGGGTTLTICSFGSGTRHACWPFLRAFKISESQTDVYGG